MDTPCVLVIDDEANFREIVSANLTPKGFKVLEAEDGDLGYEIAKVNHPNLILLDMKMPKVDGAETLARLKNDPETKDIKVIFLTNYGDPRSEFRESDKKFAEQFGAMEYIKKSEIMEELVPTLKRILGL